MCLEVALNEGISENDYRNLIRDTKTENKSDFNNWKLTTRKDCPKTTAGNQINTIHWDHYVQCLFVKVR